MNVHSKKQPWSEDEELAAQALYQSQSPLFTDAWQKAPRYRRESYLADARIVLDALGVNRAANSEHSVVDL